VTTRGKKYTDAARRFDRQQLHSPTEAVDLVKSLAGATFDETVELAVKLGVDPRRADQIVRAKPAAAKGRYIRSITVTTTMGPGLHIDPTRTRDIVEELEVLSA